MPRLQDQDFADVPAGRVAHRRCSFLACYLAFGLTLEALKWAIFSAVMVVLVFTDLRERILPDVVNYTGLAFGLVLSLFTRPADGLRCGLRIDVRLPSSGAGISLVDALLGARVGAASVARFRGVFPVARREGMGLGDVKMMLMVGAFLGPSARC